MAAPSMKERQFCWGACSHYWQCLDEKARDVYHCQKLRRSFKSSCPQQWLKYFDKRRDYLNFKGKFEAGLVQPSESTANSQAVLELLAKAEILFGHSECSISSGTVFES
ncbi:cytochrome c oxidase assembly factor 6 homolog [Fukomys damarensis]|uniref:cytochrome c oxidase assembly factor 6 homolog n=1 Tax=Fukomys damarensis TaxID=885580 RepID=UPI001455B7AD|nr:cytochrome c oxidase assembly factor 6 homolog [Fukomys damarensis]